MIKIKKFRYKFLLSMSLLILISIYVAQIMQINILSKMMRDDLKENLQRSIKLVNKEIENRKSDLLLKGRIIEEDDKLYESLINRKENYDLELLVSRYIVRFPDTLIEVFDKKGDIVASSINVSDDIKTEDRTYIIKRALETRFELPEIEKINGELYIKSLVSITRVGENIGGVIISYKLTDKFLDDIKTYFNFEISLYNNENDLIATSIFDEKGQRDKKRTYFNKKAKTEYISEYKYFPENKFGIELSFPLKDLKNKESMIRNKIWYLNIVLIIIVLILLNIYALKLIKPINLLIDGINKVKEGKLGHNIDFHSEDEMGQAINNYNLMSNSLLINKDREKKYANLDKIASVGRLASGIAHEIKNPLASMAMIIDMYFEKFGEIEFEKRDFKVLSSEIKRINGIIEKLLDFSKVDNVNIEKINLLNLIDDIKTLVGKKAKENGNIIILEKSGNDFEINADENLIKQAILNIVINSMEACEKGEIKLLLNADIKEIKLIIKDNGKGMDRETEKKVMEPFYTTKRKGSGIGLAVVKKILDLHEFNYKIKSEKNIGTEFEIEINRIYNNELIVKEIYREEEILERRD